MRCPPCPLAQALHAPSCPAFPARRSPASEIGEAVPHAVQGHFLTLGNDSDLLLCKPSSWFLCHVLKCANFSTSSKLNVKWKDKCRQATLSSQLVGDGLSLVPARLWAILPGPCPVLQKKGREQQDTKYILGSNLHMPQCFPNVGLCGGLAFYDMRLFIIGLCYGSIISCSKITE